MIRKILMGLAAVVGFTTAATAATPVAVWDGDFSKTIEGYTLNLNGSTVSEGVITIADTATKGVQVDFASKMTDTGMTVLFKYSNLKLGSQQAIASSCITQDGTADRTGVYLDANNKSHGIWNAGTYDDNVTTQETMTEAQLSGKLVFTYKGGSGAYLYRVADAACKCIYGNPKLMSGGDHDIWGCAVGGSRATFAPAKGLKISAIAIFDKVLSEAEMAAYVFPSEVKEYYATMTGDTGFSALIWNPGRPASFAATDTLIITNTAKSVAELTINENLSALKLKIVSEQTGETGVAIIKEEDKTVAIGTYDFSEVEGQSIIAYETSASVIAGADTGLVAAKDPSLTIAEGKKLTVSYETEVIPTLTASKVSNAGTLHFMGGTAADPIELTGNANFGVITLAANTYVKHDDKAGNRKYQVTGSGAKSFFEVTRNNGGSAGMADGSTFENLILVSGADSSNTTWLEHATLTNVGLDAKGAFKINAFTPTIRSLTGSGTVGKHQTAALTIACTEAANYAGASDLAFTIAEGTALQTLSGAYTGALTVEEDGQVKLTGAANPSSISGLGSVTIASGTGVATNTSDTANFKGTITVDASVTTLNLGTSRPTCDFIFAGETTVVYTENVSDDGVVQQLNVTSGTEPTYKVIGIDGTEKVITEGKYTPSVTGKAAWYAWEFSGNLASVGQDTASMGQDHGPYYTDDNEAVYAYSQTWKNLTWPDEFTTAIACTLPTNANVCLVGWGQKSGGFALTAGDVSKNEVKLVYWPSDTQYTVLTTMTVPNASTCEHLYLVTKTANSIKVYLDGALNAEYKGALTLGLGIQVGTVFQGVGNTGLIRLDNVYSGTNDCKAVVNSLRIYKTVLGPNAMAQLVNEFPYVSPNGTFTRALTGAENQWVADGAWTKKGAGTTHAAPDAESTVDLSAAAEATITLNLDEPTDYEALNLTGDGAITIAAPAANENKISSSGLVKIGSDATIEYSAMSLAGTTIEIAADKTLTIDCSMIDLSQYYATTTIPLTGLVTGEGEIAFEVPEAVTGRSAEAQFNESNNTWELKITADNPFAYNDGAWTWGDDEVSAETVSNHTEVTVFVETGTLEWAMDRANFKVGGYGLLKALTAPTAPCTVLVDDNHATSSGTFDLNGIASTTEANNFAVTLVGGKLINSSETKALIKSLTVKGGSKIDTSVGVIAIQNYAEGWGKTTITLDDDAELTKTGTNRLELVTTTVTGEGTISVAEGTLWTQEDNNFGDATVYLYPTGVFEVRAGKTATVKRIETSNVEGAKIIVHGTISAFTFKGKAMLEGNGTWGTITLDNASQYDTILNLGGKRGLALEGNGNVKAELTLLEMAAAEPITLFTTTEGDFEVVLKDYNGRTLGEDEYTIEGGVVTPKAVPFIYNDGWSWNGDAVTPEIVAAVPAAQIVVDGGTCEWNMDRLLYMVNGGTLKATGATKANGAITVNGGAFDVNGQKNTTWTVVLMGGSLVNNGSAIGNTTKQINLLTVEDYDSTVGGSANFGLIADGYKATTLNLGGQKLTKTGAATFWICNATVTNGTFEVAEGTLQTVGEKDERVVVFANDASLVLDKGTTLAVVRPLTIGAIEAKGATIDNTKSITAFSLKGEATLSGNGTWGTITLDSKFMNPAVLNVGNLRDFTLDGDGTVNVELTDMEYDAGEVTVFTNKSEYVKIGTVIYNSKDITQDCTISGGKITAISKGIWTVDGKQYPTLAKAYESLDASAGGTIKLMTSTNIEEETSSMFEIRKDYVTLDLGGNELTMAKGFDIYNTYFTLTNGTLNTTGVAIEFVPTSDVELVVSGGVTVTSGSDALVATNGTVTINGGTFTAGTDGYAVKASGGEVAITGGTFNGLVANVEASTALTGNITGGKFSVKPDDSLVAEGYKLVQEGDYWKVVACIAVESVTLNHEKALLMKDGEPLQLAITAITPANADTNKVEWSSDTTTCATVDETGLVTPVTSGTAEITCKVSDKTGGYATATCTITVREGTLYYEPVIENDEVKGYVAMSNVTEQIQTTTGDYELKTGWYRFSGSQGCYLDGSYVVSGDVKLIIPASFEVAAKSIRVPFGSSLTIYSQSTNDTSKLTLAGCVDYAAGIGGMGQENSSSGAITINGGQITAKGGYNAAGIGGGCAGNGGAITINGGIVKATGGYGGGAGIGGGVCADGTNIVIRAGSVTAIGGDDDGRETVIYRPAAGIGGGGGSGSVANGVGKDIRIIGGVVEATAGTTDVGGGTPAVGIGGGATGATPAASSNIFAKDSVVIVAGKDYASSTVVEHQSTTDLAGVEAFNKPYVGAGKIPTVDPSQGGVIECDDEETATALAAAITANPSKYVKAPEGVTDVAAYQAMFKASASGTTVTLGLTDVATSNLLEQVGEDVKSAAADLTNPTTAKTTLTNVTPGMYYWIKGATDVKAAWKDGDAVMADSKKSVELTKPTFEGTQTQSFYKISVDFKAPTETDSASYLEYWGGGEAQSI